MGVPFLLCRRLVAAGQRDCASAGSRLFTGRSRAPAVRGGTYGRLPRRLNAIATLSMPSSSR